MTQTLILIIPWIVVPVILFYLLIFSMTIVARVKETELKVSARAGFWAGLILCIIFIVSQLPELKEPNFKFNSIPGIQYLPLLCGILLGFLFLWAVRFLLPTRFVGITTLLLTVASTCAVYSYIFIESIRVTILYLSLGVAFGVLFHIVIFPDSIRKLWEITSSS